MTQTISNSEMGTFRTCRMKHGFEYVDLLRPRLPSSVLTWGNCIHAGLEAGYRAAFGRLSVDVSLPGGDVTQVPKTRLERALAAGGAGVRSYHADYLVRLDELVRDGFLDEAQAQERFDDAAALLDVALWSVAHFFTVTQSDLDGRLIPLGFELPFDVPIYNAAGRPTGKLRNRGVIDTLWWDTEIQGVLVDDHKTVGELVGTTEKRIDLDPQMSGYMHAAQHLIKAGAIKPLDGSELPAGAHERTGSCRYNVLKRSRPKTPKVNKVAKNDGEAQAVGREPWPEITAALKALEAEHGESMGLVSTAAIDTTAEIYAQALDAQEQARGLPRTGKQRDLLTKLGLQGDRYFARFEFWRNAQERERWRRELMAEARLMRWAERDPDMRTRNPGACSAPGSMPCAYKAVCMDDQPETRALYRVAERKHEEVGIDDRKHG